MTNYNERLFEIIRKLCHDFENREVDSLQAQVDAKAAITSLIKELVAEAEPGTWVDPEDTDDLEWQGYVNGVEHFEQNLLKALENGNE